MNLIEAIEASWSAETSVDPAWTPDNPALGQCAVTSLVVQDYCGGDLVRTTVDGVSHYFNRLPGGSELDLTRSQFPVWRPTVIELRDRAYVLSFSATAARYEALRAAVTERLGGAA